MSLRLSAPPAKYDQTDATQMRRELMRADGESYKRGEDVEIQAGQRVILRSPNGARWMLTVSNGGTVGATAL